jgi:hypothetical protein
MIFRVSSGKPVFFFEKGHMFFGRSRGIKYIYDDCEPIYLDMEQPLLRDHLKVISAISDLNFSKFTKYLHSATTPKEMLTAVMSGKHLINDEESIITD